MKRLFYIFISLVVLAGGVYLLSQIAPKFLGKLEPEVAPLSLAPDFILSDLSGQKRNSRISEVSPLF